MMRGEVREVVSKKVNYTDEDKAKGREGAGVLRRYGQSMGKYHGKNVRSLWESNYN